MNRPCNPNEDSKKNGPPHKGSLHGDPGAYNGFIDPVVPRGWRKEAGIAATQRLVAGSVSPCSVQVFDEALRFAAARGASLVGLSHGVRTRITPNARSGSKGVSPLELALPPGSDQRRD